ncbi:MAG: UDP-3-O-(3-hydroxymyristoyl)glucosamine N-acyltransferase [Planctomycetaceae bacterium]|nr:MAG: UDP-3-O-(3-hydroxymyristoyl)glucosamine N-acyltransferase [Planctomycetaceae bacterium]
MAFSLGELARLLNGQLCGDDQVMVTGADTLRDARDGEITFLDHAKLLGKLSDSRPVAVVVPRELHPQGIPYIRVDHVQASFARIVTLFRPPIEEQSSGIHPTAVISPTAKLGENVVVHAHAVIGAHVQIGAGARIHSGVRIMAGCKLGEQVVVFPNAVLYENTRIGARSILHAHSVIGAYGFGYQLVDDTYELSAQLGNVVIGDDVEIGAGSTIDRGTYGATVIGDGTKIDNQVMIAHNCRIGRHNMICSQVGIAGSTTTGDYVVMAGQVGVRDHVHIGDHAMLGAKAGVMNDVPDGAAYVGIPATPERQQMMIQAALHRLPELKKQLKALQRLVEQAADMATLFNNQQEAA